MALRLSQPDPAAPEDAVANQSAWRGPVQAGALALSRQDLTGWRSAFASAREIEQRHGTYRARRQLMEDALAFAGACPAPLLADLFMSIARCAVDALEHDAREPRILNYGGVAFYELGSLNAAERLFKAAMKLDSEVPHVRDNLVHVSERRKRGAQVSLPAGIAAALPTIARRAEKVCSLAVPAKGLKLSLCMIVKDEEEMLPACLGAAADAVDELIVVDTGSTDRTVEIAESFGAKVLHHEWTGSFGDARNVSFDAASGDWVIYLDADEVLVADDAQRLRGLTGHVWREAFYLVETNHTGEVDDGTAVTHNALRMFRNRPDYRFEGRIHEQLAQHLPGDLPERIELTDVRVDHFGYLGAVRDAKNKSRRNIELLERQAAEGDDSPFHAFNLGSEYAAAGDAAAALAEFRRSWEMIRGTPDITSRGFVPSLLGRLVKALRIQGEHEAADRQAREGLELLPGFTDLVFEQALSARDLGNRDRAAELFELCLEWGDAPSGYSATVGCGSYLALVSLAELRSAEQASELLKSCLEQYPAYLGAVFPYAAALLDAGMPPGEVSELVESKVANANTNVHFLVGTALYERGHALEAERHFRAVLDRQPDSAPALLALCECALSLRRYAEAAEFAQAVPDEIYGADAAARVQAFAALIEGDTDAAATALERARAVELASDEVQLLSAWRELIAGGDGPAGLPAACARPLTAMLEALLRVEEIDAFARLVALVERLDVAWRERRELLASMYLRRGFLDSAADEWIEVCNRELDARALVGLTQVALARELPEDARAFAQEAVAIAPEDPLAHAAARAAGVA